MNQDIIPNITQNWKRRLASLKTEVYALYLAYKDPRVSWLARIFAAAVVAYAVSPIDLIPDPIPIIGYLDDLLLIPLGVWLALKMIPPEVLADCRLRAQAAMAEGVPVNRGVTAVIIATWVVTAVALLLFLIR
jgi:uncharacterized membrane protein YkvA (DUF1232 family)